MEMHMEWGTIIAWYLFLAGLSAGAFITSVYVEKKYPGRHRFLLISRVIALVSVCVGLLLLIIDAPGSHHNPLSLVYLLCGIKTSVMSWGVVILAVASVVQFLYVVFELMRKKDNGYTRLFKKIQRPLEIVGVVAAVGLAAYTGLLVGVVKTVPLWNNALLPVLFTVSAFSAGAAATQFFGGLLAPAQVKGQHGVTKIHCLLLIFELILIAVMFFIVNSGNKAGADSVAMLLSGKYALYFWGLLIVAGLAVPAAVELWEISAHKRGAAVDSVALIVVVEALVLVGGFMLRYLVIKAAVPIDFLGF